MKALSLPSDVSGLRLHTRQVMAFFTGICLFSSQEHSPFLGIIQIPMLPRYSVEMFRLVGTRYLGMGVSGGNFRRTALLERCSCPSRWLIWRFRPFSSHVERSAADSWTRRAVARPKIRWPACLTLTLSLR